MARRAVRVNSERSGFVRRSFGLPFDDLKGSSPELRNQAFAEAICSIPRGKVATYGQVAEAAGYPRYHRAVAHFLRTTITDKYPWQRVIGANGEIKLSGEAAAEQRLRLKMEKVTFAGKRVNLKLHQHSFESE